MRKQTKDRNQLNQKLVDIANDLSGEMYGYLIGFREAMRMIKGA